MRIINAEWIIDEVARRDTTDGSVKAFSGKEIAEIIADYTEIACENCKYWAVEEQPLNLFRTTIRRCKSGFSDNDLYTFPYEYCSNWEGIEND